MTIAFGAQFPLKGIRLGGTQTLQRFSLLQPLDGEDFQAAREIYFVILPQPKEAISRQGLSLQEPHAYDRAGARNSFLKGFVALEPDRLSSRP